MQQIKASVPVSDFGGGGYKRALLALRKLYIHLSLAAAYET